MLNSSDLTPLTPQMPLMFVLASSLFFHTQNTKASNYKTIGALSAGPQLPRREAGREAACYEEKI